MSKVSLPFWTICRVMHLSANMTLYYLLRHLRDVSMTYRVFTLFTRLLFMTVVPVVQEVEFLACKDTLATRSRVRHVDL